MNILWEDRFLILAEKPVGTLSQPAPGEGGDMLSLLAKARAEKGEAAVVYPVHRLDRGVGGVMVFAKDSKTAGKLSALFQQNTLCKEYRAVVHGIPEAPEGTFRDLLFRDAGRGKTFVVQRRRAAPVPHGVNRRMGALRVSSHSAPASGAPSCGAETGAQRRAAAEKRRRSGESAKKR